MTQSLGELEQLCNVMYNSHNPNERAHAEGVLRPFSSNPEYIPQCKVRRDAWLFFARAHPFNNTRRRSARGRRGTGQGRTRTCFAKLETRARAPIRTGVDRASARTARLETRARLDRSPEAARRSAFASASSTKKKLERADTSTRCVRHIARTLHRRLFWTAPHLRTRSSSRRRRSRSCSRTSLLCPRRRAPRRARTR